MTRKWMTAGAAACGVLIVLGAYQAMNRDGPVPVERVAGSDAGDGTPAAAGSPAAETSPPDPSVAKPRNETPDPEQLAEAYADLTETIGGHVLWKDRNCDVQIVTLPNADGTATEALRCTPRVRQERPYEHYGAGTLRQMAYGDPEAAAELGYRLIDLEPAEGTRYLLRAVALDPGYAREIETIRHSVYPPKVNVDNQLELAAGSYLFAKLRSRIDGDYERMLGIAASHFAASGGTEEQRAVLDARAAELYEHLRKIRLDVVGDDTLEVSP